MNASHSVVKVKSLWACDSNGFGAGAKSLVPIEDHVRQDDGKAFRWQRYIDEVVAGHSALAPDEVRKRQACEHSPCQVEVFHGKWIKICFKTAWNRIQLIDFQ